MKRVILFVFLIFISCAHEKTSENQLLRVSENSRYLVKKDGSPFLYLGDTAWELFHRLNREEAVEYLENRAEKGFTVIQAVVLAEQDGLGTPNAYGELPLIDLDPTQPNEKYFEHVDYIVNKAEDLGLVVGMLPTWGDKVTAEHGGGSVIFYAENAGIYGEFLGKRYVDKPIIWILGGDRFVTNLEVLEIWRAMAKGLRKGDEGSHLITFHPRGGISSSAWLHNEEWLDFNLYQSGHANKFNPVYEFAENDYLLQPTKPCIDGEPAYEDIQVKFWDYLDWGNPLRVPVHVLDNDLLIKDKEYFKEGIFTDYDVRVHAYWNLLSGACGYTYGNNAIWQMYKKGESFAIPCLYDWRDSMDRPGADDIRHIRALFESRLFSKLIPDQSIIYGLNYRNDNHIRAACANDGSFMVIYLAKGQDVQVVMDKMTGEKSIAWWYNPRDGEVYKIGEFDSTGISTYSPPTNGIGEDWVLVIDDAAKGYAAPGMEL